METPQHGFQGHGGKLGTRGLAPRVPAGPPPASKPVWRIRKYCVWGGGQEGTTWHSASNGFMSEQCFTWEALVPWPPGHGKMQGPGCPRPCISHRLPDAATLGPHSAAPGVWAPDSPGGEFLGPTQTYSISALGMRPPGCVSWPPGSPAAGSGLKAALDPWLSAHHLGG